MQIKMLKFLSFLFIVCISNSAFAGIIDWFGSSCKRIDNVNGQQIRAADIKGNPNLKNAKFYSGLCNGKKPSTGNSYCVKMFSDSQVHDMGQAINIAKDYAKSKNNHNITCEPAFFECKDNDDHILCSNANNSAHYEFVFDDITEKSDLKYLKGIAKSYCKIGLGEDGYVNNPRQVYDAKELLTCWPNFGSSRASLMDLSYKGVSKEKREAMQPRADLMNSLLSKYGFTARNYNGYIDINFKTKGCGGLETYGNVDNHAFNLMQIDLTADTVAWLGQYVMRVTGKQNAKFKCDLSAKICLTHDSKLKNPWDNYLRCYLDDHPIEFQFDDLSESYKRYQNASKAAMECVSQDGVFDGTRCRGLEKKDCVPSKFNGAEVKWDPTLQACTITDAKIVSNINRGVEITSTVVLAAGITVATIFTGGGTVVVALAVTGTVTAAGSQAIISKERADVDKFTTDLMNCRTTKSQSERECIRQKFVWFIDHGSNYMNNLTSGEIDAIDKILARKIAALDLSVGGADEALYNSFEKSKQKSLWDRCKGDALQGAKCTLDAMSIIVDFLPVTRAALKAPEALGVLTTKIGTKLPNTTRALSKLRTSSNAVRQGLNVSDKIDTLNDITTGVSGAGAI